MIKITTVKIPKWRIITTNKRGDTGTHGTFYTKHDAKDNASDLRKKNREMIKIKSKLWIGYKSVRVERTPYSTKRKK